MPVYDDEKTRKDDEHFAELLKNFRRLTPEEMDKITEQIPVIKEGLTDFHEKQEDDGLTPEDILALDKIEEKIKLALKQIEDHKLILGQKIYAEAMRIMEAYRKAGEAGDAEAQAAYEKMYASWLETQKPKDEQSN